MSTNGLTQWHSRGWSIRFYTRPKPGRPPEFLFVPYLARTTPDGMELRIQRWDYAPYKTAGWRWDVITESKEIAAFGYCGGPFQAEATADAVADISRRSMDGSGMP